MQRVRKTQFSSPTRQIEKFQKIIDSGKFKALNDLTDEQAVIFAYLLDQHIAEYRDDPNFEFDECIRHYIKEWQLGGIDLRSRCRSCGCTLTNLGETFCSQCIHKLYDQNAKDYYY